MNETYPPSDFDDWAATYDESVSAGSGFPFQGYASVLATIVQLAPPEPGLSVLDLGIGTGNLAKHYSDRSCKIWGLDFSEKMLELAQTKIPDAVLARADLRSEWPASFKRKYDRIVSAYTFHHFLLEEKTALVSRIVNEYLAPAGKLVIGDIAFQNADAEAACRQRLGSDREQEEYWLADETLAAFTAAGLTTKFKPVTYCVGVFQIAQG